MQFSDNKVVFGCMNQQKKMYIQLYTAWANRQMQNEVLYLKKLIHIQLHIKSNRSCLQSSTLNHRASSYLYQPLVGGHFQNPLLHYLNCQLQEEVVGTCWDSQSCLDNLHCYYDILKWASAGFHLYFLLQVFSQSFYSRRKMVPHVKGVYIKQNTKTESTVTHKVVEG